MYNPYGSLFDAYNDQDGDNLCDIHWLSKGLNLKQKDSVL